MKTFDFIIAWIDYIIEWVTYGTKCGKAITGSVSHLRDTWPTRPIVASPRKRNVDNEAKASVSDNKSPEGSGDQRSNDPVLGSGVSV